MTAKQLSLDDLPAEPEQAPVTDGSRFVSAEELRTCLLYSDPSSPPRVDYDMRNKPVGPWAQVWEFDRMIYPRKSATHRVRQHIKVMHCPEGWYGRSGTRTSAYPEICSTLWEWLTRPRDARDGFVAFHEERPVVWRIEIAEPARGIVHRYCEAEMPDEYRPANLARQCAEAAARPAPKREKRPVEVSYYATVDTLATTGKTVVHCWYRVREGRHAGRIEPWPPRRSHFGVLYRSDVPAGLMGEAREAWKARYFAECRAIRQAAIERIAGHGDEAAALFAALHENCCCCGRALTDRYSVSYGIGPECRQGLPAELLTRLAARTAEAHASRARGELPETGDGDA